MNYPFSNALFTKNNGFKEPLFTTDRSCLPTQEYKENCKPDVMYGYQKPLNERCPIITGVLDKKPDEICTSPWNNLTRRKSLVKDY